MAESPRGTLSQSYRNFRDSDAPFATKLRMLFSNNLKKVRTRSGCCGNGGEPGC